jgi:hypothetical protein
VKLPAILFLPMVWVAACGGNDLPQAQRLWTMADLQAESHRAVCANPGGLPCNYLVAPGAAGNDVLQFKLAFAQGQPMAYMTTDFWLNYDRIWLEPMYILVTAWNAMAPAQNRLLGSDGTTPAGPIFSVGPLSAFYSPFWQVLYVEVPPETAPDKYTSARQLFEDGLVMHTGPNRFASIGPADVDLPSSDDITHVAPDVGDYLKSPGTVDQMVASSKKLYGWLDGALVSYVDFGTDNFAADAAQVIQELPLFLFEHFDASGNLALFGAPNVGGVAPLFSASAGHISADGRPAFGALWRLHVVTLPATARMYPGDLPPASVPPELASKVQRVALDGKCFTTLTPTNDTCTWLDSQAAIEANIGAKGITRTGLQPACPFVMFNGIPVPYR